MLDSKFIIDGSDGLKKIDFGYGDEHSSSSRHPITEEITGIDIVAWQFDVAMGMPMEKKQKDVSLKTLFGRVHQRIQIISFYQILEKLFCHIFHQISLILG